MQKDVQFAMCFQNRAIIPLKRRGGCEKLEVTEHNVKMGNLGGLGKVKMGVLKEWIYWIEEVIDRGRKESLSNGRCINDWSGCDLCG